MATDDRLNETVSRWLEEAAPERLPERVLEATFERTRRRRQQVGWRAILGKVRLSRSTPVVRGAVVVALIAALTLGIYRGWSGVGAPTLVPATHAGDWTSNDPPPESSNLTMAVVALPDGSFDVIVRDDAAAVCSGAPSTMTGIAEPGGPGTIVIAQPAFVCDDGTRPQALSGPPLEEQLRGLAFTYDVTADVIHMGGLIWTRVGVGTGASAAPRPADVEPVAFTGAWESTDGPPDESHLTMDIAERADGAYDVTILDDDATVCGGASSTMTGIAEPGAPGTIIIERPVYVCDDGSEAQAVSGPPLDVQLADLTFEHIAPDALGDSLGLTWTRAAMNP